MISRRGFLRFGAAGLAAGGLGLSSYAFAIEPRFRLVVTRYTLRPPGFPALQRKLRIAALADIHACEPWMPVSRIDEIVAATNALKPDLVVLLGDYVAGLKHFRTAIVPIEQWAKSLSRLEAPLGVKAVLGNHDWWDDVERVKAGLVRNNITVLQNAAMTLSLPDMPDFWLAGLDDQLAYRGGADDLPGTMAKVLDDKPVVMIMHEPHAFRRMPERVSLTLCGHTHGGQVALPFIGRPVIPGPKRYAYGHVAENGKNLLISGGLGMTNIPVRFGVPPEIMLVELG